MRTKTLKKNKSRVSLFVEPSLTDLIKAKNLNADCVEIHAGKFCNLINKSYIKYQQEYSIRYLLYWISKLFSASTSEKKCFTSFGVLKK